MGEDSVVSRRDASELRQSRETFQVLADPTKKQCSAQAHPLLLRGPQGRIGLTLALESLHRSSLSLNPPGRSCDSSPVPLPMALSPSPGFRLRGQRIHDPSSCFLFYWLEALMLLSSLCQYTFVNYSNNEIKHVKMGKNWHSSCRRHWPIQVKGF